MNPAYEMLASRRVVVVDKDEFDAMYMRAFPAQRMLDITLPIPAVFKDGIFYIPVGALAIKYPTEQLLVMPKIPEDVFKIIDENQKQAERISGAQPIEESK